MGPAAGIEEVWRLAGGDSRRALAVLLPEPLPQRRRGGGCLGLCDAAVATAAGVDVEDRDGGGSEDGGGLPGVIVGVPQRGQGQTVGCLTQQAEVELLWGRGVKAAAGAAGVLVDAVEEHYIAHIRVDVV